MKTLHLSLVALVAASGCGLAMAQKAGSFSASIGATQISLSVGSGSLSAPSLPGTKVDINSNSQLTGAVNYMVTDGVGFVGPVEGRCHVLRRPRC